MLLVKKLSKVLVVSIMAISLFSCQKKGENLVGKVTYKVEAHGNIFFEKNYDINDNTCYEILKQTGLKIEDKKNAYGVYIVAIEDYREFAEGPSSGWIYYINGEYAPCESDQYYLQDGDEILWKYISE